MCSFALYIFCELFGVFDMPIDAAIPIVIHLAGLVSPSVWVCLVGVLFLGLCSVLCLCEWRIAVTVCTEIPVGLLAFAASRSVIFWSLVSAFGNKQKTKEHVCILLRPFSPAVLPALSLHLLVLSFLSRFSSAWLVAPPLRTACTTVQLFPASHAAYTYTHKHTPYTARIKKRMVKSTSQKRGGGVP